MLTASIMKGVKGWGVQFDIHPLDFPKMYFLETGWGSVFFKFNFDVIISHIFPANVIKIPQVFYIIWRFTPPTLCIYFSDFLTFPYDKETNGVTYNRWCQQIFYSKPTLSRLFNTTYLHVCDWYCHVSENIVEMRMQSR